MSMRRHLILVAAMGVVVTGSTLLPGCRSKESKKRYRTLEGTVHKIDPATGRVSMSCYVPNVGKTMIIWAEITKETEIYIDGKLADISQIKPDDEVVAEGYKQGTSIIVTRVNVDRKGGRPVEGQEKPPSSTASS